MISGDAGSDVLIGGADHDILYGHSASGAGDDNAIDYLYGDFGTNENEPESGADQLFGQGGNDYQFGEGGNDLIPEFGVDNWVDFGNGLLGPAETFTIPVATAAPAPGDFYNSNAEGALPSGSGDWSRWGGLSGSAAGFGLSGNPAPSIELAIGEPLAPTWLGRMPATVITKFISHIIMALPGDPLLAAANKVVSAIASRSRGVLI